MKKFLLGIVVLSIFIAGCSSSETRSQEITEESRAKQEIAKCMEAAVKGSSSFSIKDCIYAVPEDSCFIFSGVYTTPEMENISVEYLYRISDGDKLIAIKNIKLGGSLLRNINNRLSAENKTDREAEIAEAINNAAEKSGVNLSMTIYNDLNEGSLIDITDALSPD